ncbi:C1 family peptidase [Lacihabitans sp. CS3-21]|uniref:C1 family peptidase n=1 Tax=Lacihabitans sp. CS3-21 TaxID=2487332 RepID=UPI0020CDE974|nr:C1 family peptidase [Lacihabitans sp. CS3-21]MCP9745165.1 hypothetical protein [Lacihabitans sp. CS3-21]
MKTLSISTIFYLLVLGITSQSCKITEALEPDDDDTGNETSSALYKTGWLGNDNLAETPNNIRFGFASSTTLPSSFDNSKLMPPVKSQGQYGTCVSWATGYYAKTATEGISFNYGTAELANEKNQISAKDLFTSLPEGNSKGDKCDGSSYIVNFEMLQKRGAATLDVVPYTNLGDCSSSAIQTSWTKSAENHKIKNYRTIESSVVAIKQQIANRVPVVMGAKLSDNFMSWNSDNVLSSNTTFNNTGQHTYHALTIVGYDNNKGLNGAFKIINSWGTGWGSKGFIWIDYNFLINTFLQRDQNGNGVLMVMSDGASKPNGDPTPPPPTEVDQVSGIELVSWVEEDYSTATETKTPSSRSVVFDIYNDGEFTATPVNPWKVYYLYYNSKNANDYGIIFNYNFTTKNLAPNKYNCASGNSCDFNLSIPSWSSFSEELFGSAEGVLVNYTMPSNLTGSYYIVLVSDAEDVFQEYDEDDNFFYTTDDPIIFRNGEGGKISFKSSGKVFSFKNTLSKNSPTEQKKQFYSTITPNRLNDYSPEEIGDFIAQKKKSGELDRKIKAYENDHRNNISIEPYLKK